jgi:Zn ribbon nucleic-acid-binding protein
VNQLVGRDNDGTPVLILVLEPGNIHRIVSEANPIDLRVESMFPDGIPRKLRLVVAHSETPVADARAFAGMADVALDERTPKVKTTRPHCPECHSSIEQLGVWRNESPMAISFCVACGCVFGMVPSEIAKGLKP